jgi:biopolymer transport protein ExbB/TolQ
MTVLEIFGVFSQSFGSSKSTVLGITAGGLSQSMAPTLVGLAVAYSRFGSTGT